jgi:hypothetical protein
VPGTGIFYKESVELLSLLQTLLVRGNLEFKVFIHQMRCAVWTVDFAAFTDFAVAFAASFHLRASIAISRQHHLVTSFYAS